MMITQQYSRYTDLHKAMQTPGNIMHGFIEVDVNLTKEECLSNGMSAKEYNIQLALGSLPTKTIRQAHLKDKDGKDIFIDTPE